MISRKLYLELREGPAPEASAHIEREGYATLAGLLEPGEVAALRADVERVYRDVPPDVRNPHMPADHWHDFRYQMLNRSGPCQELVADRRILDVVEPLLGEDCHVIANTAWRNPPSGASQHGGANWHMDAGPHVPRPAGVPWDDRIPYPVFAVAVHVQLQDCPAAAGPTEVLAGSHRSGQAPPADRVRDDGLTFEGRHPVQLSGVAGDVALFASDVWHRRAPTSPGDPGRFFLQIHYGRRDLAQRLRPTAETHQLSEEAHERAGSGRAATVAGLHHPFFYDG